MAMANKKGNVIDVRITKMEERVLLRKHQRDFCKRKSSLTNCLECLERINKHKRDLINVIYWTFNKLTNVNVIPEA